MGADATASYIQDSADTDSALSISTTRVGIGTAAPDGTVHCMKASAGTIDSDANAVLTIENDDTAALQILCPEANNGYILMGNPNDGSADGRLRYNNSTREMSLWTSATERLTIDSDGNVGIGTAVSPSGLLNIEQSADSTSTTAGIALNVQTAGASGELTASENVIQVYAHIKDRINQSGSAGYTTLLIDNTDVASVGSGTKIVLHAKAGGGGGQLPCLLESVQASGDAEVLRLSSNNTTRANGDEVILTFYGDDSGGTSRKMGEISSRYVNTTGNGSTAMDFYTLAAGSEVSAMTIDEGGDVTVETGNLVIGTAGKGIDFSAQSPSSATGATTGDEVLDHYEEGYITETITCEGSGGYNLNGSLNTLAYTKIGRVVHIQGSIQVDSENSPSGILQIDLPFTSASLTENSDVLFVPGFQLRNHGDAGLENCVLEIVASASKAAFHNFTDAGTKEGISESRVDTAFDMYFSFSYIAA